MQHILPGNNEPDVGNRAQAEIDQELAEIEALLADTSAPSTTTEDEPSVDELEAQPLAPTPETPAEEPLEVTTAIASEPPTPPAEAARPNRHYGRFVAIAAVVALVGGLSYWGFTQHSSAADWKAQAGELDASLKSTQGELKSTQATLSDTKDDLAGTKDQLADTKDKLSDTQDKLTLATNKLATANAQIEDLTAERDRLETQVGTLANDKAQIEDEREQLTAVLETAPAMTAALRSCVAANGAVSLELLDVLDAWPYRSLDKTSRLVDEMSDACDDAFAKTDAFEATLANLGV